MTFNQTITFPSYIMFQEFDNESILLDIRTQEHFSLDTVASLFISQLHKGKNIEDSFNLILDSYEVLPEQLNKDLDSLLKELLKHELIEVT